jgi:ribosomal protein L11 methyltransferase
MPQTRLSLRTDKATASRLFSAIEAAFDDEGHPLALSEIDEARDVHELSLYVEADPGPVEARLRSVLESEGVAARLQVETLPDIDWVTHSLEGLQPVRAGRFLVHGAHDRNRRRIGDLAIEIEAGLAFGTGHHATTVGCLELIGAIVRREHPRNALDLGTGSGVLAIALGKLAHIPVLATDIDPVAVRVAGENVRLNGASPFVTARTAGGFHHPAFAAAGPFDLIVANILARPLMQLAPAMRRHLAPGGSLILSGILARQRNAVLAAYSGARFRHISTRTRDEWVTLHLK